jgi:hypothetical protein
LDDLCNHVGMRSRPLFLPALHTIGTRASKTIRCLFLLGFAGIMQSCSSVSFAGAEAITGASMVPGPIIFPAGFMPSIKDYGAIGDGKTDDTAAIQAALADGRTSATADYNGKPKALYFPPGVYLVSDTLTWNGCCVTLQGDGSSTSVIRLSPNSNGYADAATPKSVVTTAAPNTNESFRQNIWDLGISVGSGNPGAIALTYVSNNVGSIHNVSILSEDGHGVTGLDLTHHYPGPMMVKNLSIQGFQTGIDSCRCYEYSATIEGLTLINQSVLGIHDLRQTLNIRNFKSTNTVPALFNDGAMTVLIDASLGGGISVNQAVLNNSTLYLRNVTSSGYGETLQDTSGAEVRHFHGSISEYVSSEPVHLFATTSSSSLKLSIQETPTFTSPAVSDWEPVVPRWYGDTSTLQATFDSGKSIIYFPSTEYFAYNQATVIVPESVKRVVGFSSVVNKSTAGKNGGGIQLVVDSDSSEPLIIEQFGYGIQVVHRGTRPVVLKDGTYTYLSAAGAGNLFLEDVGLSQTEFHAGQKVWARQLDDEAAQTKLINSGSLWILGLKTEQGGTVIQTGTGGETELLGALIYPAKVLSASDVAFRSTDALTSYIYRQDVYCTLCGYAKQVVETKNGNSSSMTASPNRDFVMSLFVGH